MNSELLILNVKPLNELASSLYKSNEEQIVRNDSGYDLYYCGEDTIIKSFEVRYLGTGISAELLSNNGYYLLPRSSISKTPLIFTNSVGLIDNGYRGEIKAAVRNVSVDDYELKSGVKLFQIVMHDLKPFKVNIVDELSNTIRGDGGFGSTNK